MNPVHVLSQYVPTWAAGVLAMLLALAAVVGALSALAGPVRLAIGPAWRMATHRWYPQTSGLAGFLHKRKMFAARVLGWLTELDSHESWQDNRFTELEAEVEIAENRERIFRRWRHSPTRHVTLRREKSLTRALRRSDDSVILLEGEPGSGKSVALRHLATYLARRISRQADSTAELPLYINLKSFRPAGPLGADSIREFILQTISQMNDIDIYKFVSDALEGKIGGRKRGGPAWLLLFDSFDEIPEVLSAIDANLSVKRYAKAIDDFIAPRSDQFRCIVASRLFRGPTGLGLTRFHIVSLSDGHQKTLIRRIRLDPETERQVVENVAAAGPEFGLMARNPMFLALICEYARINHSFPSNVHTVYETYLNDRFGREGALIMGLYNLSPDDLRGYAEDVAYCMAAVDGMGLSPPRPELAKALCTIRGQQGAQISPALNALVTTKLGRGTDQLGGAGPEVFTFTHRRIQEYFATCVVLREPALVSPEQLLTDGRWRESAVTILQTQSQPTIQPLLDEAMARLRHSASSSGRFSWPAGVQHLLGILAQGLGRSPSRLGEELRELAGEQIKHAWRDGRREDKAAGLDAVLCATDNIARQTLNEAFAGVSSLLRERAFRQVAWISDPPDSIDRGIRQIIIRMWADSQLWPKRTAVRVQLGRLPSRGTLLRMSSLLLFILPADFALLMVTAGIADAIPRAAWMPWPCTFVALAISHLGLHMRRDGMADTSSQLQQAPFKTVMRRLLPNAFIRRTAGRTLRWAAAVAVSASLLVTQPTSPLTITVTVFLFAIIAWPDAMIDYVILRRSIWLRRVDRTIAGWTVAVALIIGVIVLLLWIGQGSGASQAAQSTPNNTSSQSPHDQNNIGEIIGFILIGLVGLCEIGFLVFGSAIFAIRRYRARHTSALTLRRAKVRNTQYSGDEVITALELVSSRRALRELVSTLRRRAGTCSQDALDILSDLATGADEKLRGRATRHRPPIPPGSSKRYMRWVEREKRQVWRIMGWFNQEIIDDVAILAEQVRLLQLP